MRLLGDIIDLTQVPNGFVIRLFLVDVLFLFGLSQFLAELGLLTLRENRRSIFDSVFVTGNYAASGLCDSGVQS